MKTCPICGAGAFDDAQVCYGCLHRFSEGESGIAARPIGAAKANPPALVISVQAVQNDDGAIEWRYDVGNRPLSSALPS